jgi:hypothetical protein
VTRWLATISLLAMFIIGVASHSILASDKYGRATLKGITDVFVLVEEFPDGAKKLGLSDDSVRTDVELKLRLAGLRVVTAEKGYKLPGAPHLYVNVNVTDSADAASVDIALNQNAKLERDGQFAIGITTWTTGVVISHPNAQGIRDYVKDMTDKFLNDWLAANPKK